MLLTQEKEQSYLSFRGKYSTDELNSRLLYAIYLEVEIAAEELEKINSKLDSIDTNTDTLSELPEIVRAIKGIRSSIKK